MLEVCQRDAVLGHRVASGMESRACSGKPSPSVHARMGA
nr:hypothetical protein [Kibdelosporangium sp. MJ126-NF4]